MGVRKLVGKITVGLVERCVCYSSSFSLMHEVR
jgi:hypothetical protein